MQVADLIVCKMAPHNSNLHAWSYRSRSSNISGILAVLAPTDQAAVAGLERNIDHLALEKTDPSYVDFAEVCRQIVVISNNKNT
jgi:hypothetical protein